LKTAELNLTYSAREFAAGACVIRRCDWTDPVTAARRENGRSGFVARCLLYRYQSEKNGHPSQSGILLIRVAAVRTLVEIKSYTKII